MRFQQVILWNQFPKGTDHKQVFLSSILCAKHRVSSGKIDSYMKADRWTFQRSHETMTVMINFVVNRDWKVNRVMGRPFPGRRTVTIRGISHRTHDARRVGRASADVGMNGRGRTLPWRTVNPLFVSSPY